MASGWTLLREEEEGAPELCVRVGNPLLPSHNLLCYDRVTVALGLTTNRPIVKVRTCEALQLARLPCKTRGIED